MTSPAVNVVASIAATMADLSTFFADIIAYSSN